MHYLYLCPHIILELSVGFVCNQKFCNILVAIDGSNDECCVSKLCMQIEEQVSENFSCCMINIQ